jgi:glycosyltransferase involved in cell wall biosynthesis
MRCSGLRRQYRWIAFHHGYTAEDIKMRLYNQLDRWSLPAADRVITVCGPFADVLASAGVPRERIDVLPNSIEGFSRGTEDEVHALRQQLGVRPGERIILSVGRFSPEKAQRDLIAAAGHLSRLQPGLAFRLVLVGDGPERGRVEQVAAASGLAGRIVFAGQQKNVRPYYGMADLFALPSHSEGSPNVVLEAMAAGVPIVATAVGGVPETVEHQKSALLSAAQAPEALAIQMRRLLMDPPLAERLVNNAAAVVKERFSPEAYRRSLIGIYAALCDKKKSD